MIIGIDGNEANLKNRVGSGQYAFNILLNLERMDKNNQYIIYLKEQPLADMPPSRPGWKYKVFGPKKMWTRLALPFVLFTQKEKLDLFVSLSHYSPLYCPVPTVPTIHDLGYLKTPEQFTKKDFYQLSLWTKQSIIKAKYILAVSEFTKQTIIDMYGVDHNKIFIVYNGVSKPKEISTVRQNEVLNRFDIKKPYFLYLGTLKPSKNIPFLIYSFGQFIRKNNLDDVNLVIAGKKGWLFDQIFESVKQERLLSRVVFTDFISEEEKWILYANAHVSVLPSLYEGFGIPAIESLISRTPVIVSDLPPLREILGEGGIYIDPRDSDSLVKAMDKVWKHRPEAVMPEKFTWENSTKALIDFFKGYNRL